MCLDSNKISNEKLMKKYGFNTEKEMFQKWADLQKDSSVKFPCKKYTREEMENMKCLSGFLKKVSK